MVTGYRHNVREYFEMTRQEWLAVLVTAAVAGFCLSFNKWGDKTFDFVAGLQNLAVAVVAAFALLAVHVVAQKLAGVAFGIKVIYDKYALGLLIGVFVTFLSFGYWPLFITGFLTYSSIPNLRLGKFRATMPKKWEMASIAAIGPLTSILLTIPFNALRLATGLPFFRELIVISFLIAIYALLPLPLLQTPNPYQVYMSRLESLEGNLPGFDIFFAAPVWYFLVVGIVVTFTILSLLFDPSPLILLISVVLGLLTMWFYSIFIETVK